MPLCTAARGSGDSWSTVRSFFSLAVITLTLYADEQHAHLLTPSFALSGTLPTTPPPYESMSSNEVEAYLAEMEQDIRATDRDLREIEMLEKKNVTAAGKLPDYEELQPRLENLLQAHEEDMKLAAELEKRIAALMDRYATNVRAQSVYPVPTFLTMSLRWTRCLNCLSLGTTAFKKLNMRLGVWLETSKSGEGWVMSEVGGSPLSYL